jgi:hypothetical protein
MRLIKETGVTINFTEAVSGSDFPDSIFTITGKSLGARLDAFNGVQEHNSYSRLTKRSRL